MYFCKGPKPKSVKQWVCFQRTCDTCGCKASAAEPLSRQAQRLPLPLGSQKMPKVIPDLAQYTKFGCLRLSRQCGFPLMLASCHVCLFGQKDQKPFHFLESLVPELIFPVCSYGEVPQKRGNHAIVGKDPSGKQQEEATSSDHIKKRKSNAKSKSSTSQPRRSQRPSRVLCTRFSRMATRPAICFKHAQDFHIA